MSVPGMSFVKPSERSFPVMNAPKISLHIHLFEMWLVSSRGLHKKNKTSLVKVIAPFHSSQPLKCHQMVQKE